MGDVTDAANDTKEAVEAVAFVPCELRRIPPPALAEYRTIFDDVSDGGVLSRADVKAAFRVNGIDITSRELEELVSTMERETIRESGGGSGGGRIAFEPFARCIHALVIQHREVGDATLYAVFPDSDITAETATGLLRVRRRVWTVLDDPNSSPLARSVAAVIICTILLSTAAYICETYPALRRQGAFAAFFIVEDVCVSIFTLEVALRMACTPQLAEYFAGFLNVVDIVSIAPFYLDLLVTWYAGSASGADGGGGTSSAVLRAVRLVRVFRLVKISRYVSWMKLFGRTLAQSLAPLGMVLFVTAVALVLFSSVEYYTERGEWDPTRGVFVQDPALGSDGFGSIPQTMWWCVVTFTTVGYGEVVPVTGLGKAIAVGAFFTGILLLAIPISIISANFHAEFGRMENLSRLRADHAARAAALFVEQGSSNTSGGAGAQPSTEMAALSKEEDVDLGGGHATDPPMRQQVAASQQQGQTLLPRDGDGDHAATTVDNSTGIGGVVVGLGDHWDVASSTENGRSSSSGGRVEGAGVGLLDTTAATTAPDTDQMTARRRDSSSWSGAGRGGTGHWGTGGTGDIHSRSRAGISTRRNSDYHTAAGAVRVDKAAAAISAAADISAHRVESSGWSESFLRSTLQAVRYNRRRLMSRLKAVDLQNREAAVGDVADFVADLAVRDRARAVLARATESHLI